MSPILFEAGTTVFNNNGIGRLADAISCPVTEARNGGFELTLKYPVRGRFAQEIVEGRIIYAIHDDSKAPQPFDIYKVVESSKDTITAYARHVAYRLQKYTVLPFTAIGLSGQQMLDTVEQFMVGTCPFTFYSDITVPITTTVTTPLYPVNCWSLMGDESEDDILYNYGGEYKYDGFTISLLTARGTDRGVKIRRGKNASNIKVTRDISDQLTGVVPYWTGTDLSTGNPSTVYDDQDPVVYASDHAQFAVEKIEPLDLTDAFETKPTITQVKNAATEWLARYVYNNRDQINYDVDLVNMKNMPDALKTVKLCDTVKLEDDVLGISRSLKVIKTVYDAVTERLTKIEVGAPKKTLSYTLKYAGSGDTTNNLASSSTTGSTSTNTSKQAKTNAVKIKALEQKVAQGGGGGSTTHMGIKYVGGTNNQYGYIMQYTATNGYNAIRWDNAGIAVGTNGLLNIKSNGTAQIAQGGTLQGIAYNRDLQADVPVLKWKYTSTTGGKSLTVGYRHGTSADDKRKGTNINTQIYGSLDIKPVNTQTNGLEETHSLLDIGVSDQGIKVTGKNTHNANTGNDIDETETDIGQLVKVTDKTDPTSGSIIRTREMLVGDYFGTAGGGGHRPFIEYKVVDNYFSGAYTEETATLRHVKDIYMIDYNSNGQPTGNIYLVRMINGVLTIRQM